MQSRKRRLSQSEGLPTKDPGDGRTPPHFGALKSPIFDHQPGKSCQFAAYIIAEDVWYIIPAKVVHGKRGGIRPNPSDPNSKYAPYKEAWHLLR